MTPQRLQEIAADPDKRWRDRMQCVARLVQVYRESHCLSRAQVANLCAAEGVVVSEKLIRGIEEGRATTFNPELMRPILVVLKVPREHYLKAAGMEW